MHRVAARALFELRSGLRPLFSRPRSLFGMEVVAADERNEPRSLLDGVVEETLQQVVLKGLGGVLFGLWEIPPIPPTRDIPGRQLVGETLGPRSRSIASGKSDRL